MRFWLTIILGAILLTGVSTVVLLNNSHLIPPDKQETAQAPINEAGTGGVAVIVGPNSDKHDNVPQNYESHSTFKVKNAGTGPLALWSKPTTCVCSHLLLSHKTISTKEEGSKTIQIQPGEEACVTAFWDTKDRLAQVEVGIPVGTNDPQKRELAFRLELYVRQEIITSATGFDFGTLDEREKRSVSVDIYSTLRNDLEVLKPVSTVPAFKPRVTAMNQAEKEAVKALSGYKLTIDTDGTLPIGQFREQVKLTTKISGRTEEKTLLIGGRVMGDIEVAGASGLPGSDPSWEVLDFKVVLGHKPPAVTRYIIARKLPLNENLTLGVVRPPYVKAELIRRNPKLQNYVLRATIVGAVKPGPIEGGLVSVLDNKGVPRLQFPVRGVIDLTYRPPASGGD